MIRKHNTAPRRAEKKIHEMFTLQRLNKSSEQQLNSNNQLEFQNICNIYTNQTAMRNTEMLV